MERHTNHTAKAKQAENKTLHGIEDFIEAFSDKAKIAQNKIEQGSKDWIGYVKKHPVKASLITGAVCYFLGRVMKK